jgi:hypothetical protein
MKNWKTTACAVAGALAGFVLFSPAYFPPWAVDIAKYVMVGGLAGLGISAKDYNTHSTRAEVSEATRVELEGVAR